MKIWSDKELKRCKRQTEFTSKEIDALFFLIDEYEREWKIQPEIKSISLVDFWKSEYSKDAFIIKIKNGELNSQFASEILEDGNNANNLNQRYSHEIEMMRTLSKMNEKTIEQLYCK